MKPNLFKAENNEKAAEIKEFLPVNLNTNIRTIAPFAAQSELKFIKPLLGNTLFQKLIDYYNSDNQTDVKYNTLLDYTQFANVYLAYWLGFDIIAVSLSDNGAGVKVDGDKRLYRYQEENIKKSLKDQGFNQLDTMLEYLENNIEDFPEFQESEYYTLSQNTFIPNTATFNQIYDINSSRLVFLKLRYFVSDVENMDLRFRLGDKLVTDILENQGAEKYAKILPYIRKYIVYLAISQGITELKKLPTDKGLVFESEMSDNRGNNIAVSQLTSRELIDTINLYYDKAEKYMSSVIHTLKSNPEDYPLFFEHAGSDPLEDQTIKIDNNNRKIFFV